MQICCTFFSISILCPAEPAEGAAEAAAAEEGAEEGVAEEGKEEGGDEEAATAELTKAAGKEKKLTNQFNFSERASQTYNNPFRVRHAFSLLKWQ